MGRLVQFHRIYLDTNVLIRAFEASPSDDIAQALVGMLGIIKIGQKARFVTSQLTLAEVLVHPIKKNDDVLRQYYLNLLSRSTPWLEVVRVEMQILLRAAEVRAKARLRLPDAIHLATAISAECSHILSYDADFQHEGLPGLLPPAVIRPTAENLDTIVNWLRS